MSLKRADKFSVVSVTASNQKEAESLSQSLLDSKLCACVQIVPKITSMYWWKGEIKKEEECLLIIKTHQSKIRDIIQNIEQNHPYDVPEVLEVKPGLGSSAYLDWIMSSVGL